MDEATTNFVVALTALVAVTSAPIITFVVTRAQLRSAAALTARQVEAATNTSREQIAASTAIADRQIRGQSISANRQAWINNLRDTIAELQSLAALLAMDSEDQFFSPQERVEKSHRIALLHSKTALLINPAEEDHRQLLESLGRLTTRAFHAGASETPDFRHEQGEITTRAQRVLKREWERVKSGD